MQLQPCWTTYISGFGLTGLVKVQLFFCFCTVEDTEAVMSGTNCAGKGRGRNVYVLLIVLYSVLSIMYVPQI